MGGEVGFYTEQTLQDIKPLHLLLYPCCLAALQLSASLLPGIENKGKSPTSSLPTFQLNPSQQSALSSKVTLSNTWNYIKYIRINDTPYLTVTKNRNYTRETNVSIV